MKKIFLVLIILISTASARGQVNSGNEVLKWTTWTVVQALPSITYFQDTDKESTRLQFGLRWHVTPVNYSFNANKLVSAVQFFMVNPVRRFGGSIELFAQPEWTTNSYRYSNLERFALSTGIRSFIPAIESGEYLAFSAGGKYTLRKNREGIDKNTFGLEVGMYTLYGMMGLQFNYNFSTESRYNFGLYFKYY